MQTSNYWLSQLQPPCLTLHHPQPQRSCCGQLPVSLLQASLQKLRCLVQTGMQAPVMNMLDTFSTKYNKASTAIDCQNIAFAHQQQCASSSYQVRLVEATSTCYHVHHHHQQHTAFCGQARVNRVSCIIRSVVSIISMVGSGSTRSTLAATFCVSAVALCSTVVEVSSLNPSTGADCLKHHKICFDWLHVHLCGHKLIFPAWPQQ